MTRTVVIAGQGALAPAVIAALQGSSQLVFSGAIRRPRLDPELFDNRTAQLVPRIMMAMQSGDDGALRAVLEVFEEHGLAIASVADVAPDLIPGAGVLAGEPSAADRRDAARAALIHATLGPLDVGQGNVVAQGQCLAIETLPGTQAMLDFAGRPGIAWQAGGVILLDRDEAIRRAQSAGLFLWAMPPA